MTHIVFLSKKNDGRSQIAHAFAQREVQKRKLEMDVDVTSGGTAPADQIQPSVVDTMQERGLSLLGSRPSEIADSELQQADLIIALGFDVESPLETEIREWDIPETDGVSGRKLASIRDQIEERVGQLFDELADTDD